MKLAFIVGRNAYFKFYGPVIEAALQRGWEVECWLRLAKSSKGPKAYLNPTLNDVPTFRYGSVKVRRYVEKHDCLELIAESSINAVVSIHHKHFYFSEPTPNCRFVTLQHGLDGFVVAAPNSLASSDLLCFYTPFWIEWAASYYAASEQCNPQQFRCLLQNKIVYTGFPQLDVISQIDPATVRRRWDIPLEQPVVLLLPITLANKPGAWPRFFAARGRLQQTIELVIGGILDWNLIGQYRSWSTGGWNDHSLTEAIRRFCDHNGAYLIAKGRLKDPIRPHLLAAADKALYDDSYYPATVLEAMSIADLCIHFYSTAALEAAYAGVYGLCVHRPSPRVKARAEAPIYHQLWRTNWPGSAYNYEGVNRWMTIPQVITELPGMSLADFQLDSEARVKYLTKYVGPADGNASQRVLDAISERVEQ
ncbi:MAG TPA: hypothetical protein EYP49_19155 [Anaerolineae bacterium]|nr:hypothetical protein [Anaerolineae bacterium]